MHTGALVALAVGALVDLAVAPAAPLKDSTTMLLLLLAANAAEEIPVTKQKKTMAAIQRRINMLRLLTRPLVWLEKRWCSSSSASSCPKGSSAASSTPWVLLFSLKDGKLWVITCPVIPGGLSALALVVIMMMIDSKKPWEASASVAVDAFKYAAVAMSCHVMWTHVTWQIDGGEFVYHSRVEQRERTVLDEEGRRRRRAGCGKAGDYSLILLLLSQQQRHFQCFVVHMKWKQANLSKRGGVAVGFGLAVAVAVARAPVRIARSRGTQEMPAKCHCFFARDYVEKCLLLKNFTTSQKDTTFNYCHLFTIVSIWHLLDFQSLRWLRLRNKACSEEFYLERTTYISHHVLFSP